MPSISFFAVLGAAMPSRLRSVPVDPRRFALVLGIASSLFGCAPKPPTPPEIIRIGDAVRSRRPAITRCYEAGLARNPRLEGRLRLELVIDLFGVVDRIKEDPGAADPEEYSEEPSPFPDRDVTACVIAQMKAAEFPAVGRTLTIVYPFVFKPGREQ